jgi:hypothetical protein
MLMVSNDATINGFKQTYNSFISGLKNSSIVDLFINPSMRHIMGSPSQIPFEWNITPSDAVATTNFATTINGPTEILFSYIAGVPSQSVYQIISQRLEANTEYTLAYTIEATAACEVSIDAPICGLTDLRNSSRTSTACVNQYSPTTPTTYTDYFNFVTPAGLDQIVFNITNLCTLTNNLETSANNIISVVKLFLFAGSVEFTSGIVTDDFLTNITYDGMWKLTNDGINYFPILTSGEVSVKYVGGVWLISSDGVSYRALIPADGVDTTGMPPDGTVTSVMTLNLDGKVDSTLFFVEHDEFGRHKSFTLTDTTYSIGYLLQPVNGLVVPTSPSVFTPTPTVAHNGGVWDNAYTYPTGDVVTYQNLLWASLLNSNFNHDPDVYSGNWWQEVPAGTVTNVDNLFPEYLKAYYTNHAQTFDSFNGLHALVDTAVPTNRYEITGTTPTPTLISGMGAQDTSAVRIVPAFIVQHDSTGEHVFSISGVNHKLQLSIDHTTGTKTLSFVPYTRNATALAINTFSSAFIDSSVTTTHDANGNHIITDTDGLQWELTIANGEFVFTPLFDINALQAEFNLFRQEHDRYNRHICRDTITGVFYRIFIDTDGVSIRLEPTVFEPVTDISQFLSCYNGEHGLDENHYIRSHDLTTHYRLTVNNGSFVVSAPATPAPEYNPLKAMTNSLHQSVQGNIHKFHIENGVLTPE